VDPSSKPVLETLVEDHRDEASFLWLQRRDAVHAPNYSPTQFADLDERLAAHLDGLRVAGEFGWTVAVGATESGAPEDYFPAAVLALESRGEDNLTTILDRTSDAPDAEPGVISAIGWVEPTFLRGRVMAWMETTSPALQHLGVAACNVQRTDPGSALARLITSPVPRVRARALRAAGELGRADLMSSVLSGVRDPKIEARFSASRSGVLLGDRTTALDTLTEASATTGPRQTQALQLVMYALRAEDGRDLLQRIPATPDGERLRIMGAGWLGRVAYVPWLIELMDAIEFARIAAEAFVNVTGADFNTEQLEAMPPEGFEEGPTEDPADENVEVPEDIALPWPDVARVKDWWLRNRGSFSVSTRYFLGTPISTEASVNILKQGFQRQRVAAAYIYCVLNPGAILVNTSAPAWRQERWLAKIS
jgi:uncharacterized protein (TIGR02270 family)